MKTKNVEIIEIDQEWMIMNTEEFTITKVNPLGARIMHLITREKNMEEILETIKNEYDVDNDVLRSDVLTFLEELNSAGLITYE